MEGEREGAGALRVGDRDERGPGTEEQVPSPAAGRVPRAAAAGRAGTRRDRVAGKTRRHQREGG